MFRLLRFRTVLKVHEISALNSAKLITATYLMDENLSGCHIYQVSELILIEQKCLIKLLFHVKIFQKRLVS